MEHYSTVEIFHCTGGCRVLSLPCCRSSAVCRVAVAVLFAVMVWWMRAVAASGGRAGYQQLVAVV